MNIKKNYFIIKKMLLVGNEMINIIIKNYSPIDNKCQKQ